MIRKFVYIIAVLVTTAASVYAAPAAVTNLAVVSAGFRHINLSWTVPYDSGVSTAAAYYDIRLSTYIPIVQESDWNANSTSTGYPYRVHIATQLVTEGETQLLTISNLTNNVNHYFAIKTSTDDLNLSALDTTSPEPLGAPVNTVPDSVGGHNYMNGVVIYMSTPTLAWTPVGEGDSDAAYGDYISSYTVEISTDSAFNVKSVKDNINTTSWITNPLAEDTTFYWRVRAYDSGGLASAGYLSQASRRFVINGINSAPLSFALISPLNSAIVTDPTPAFTWNITSDTDPGDYVRYSVYYSTCQDFNVACTTAVSDLTSTIHSPADNLIENATYYWKAYAYDQWGKAVMSSSTGTVRINGNTSESPYPFTITSPKNRVEINTTSATFVWGAATDPDPGESVTYTVEYSSSDTSFSVPGEYASSASLVFTQYTTPALQEDTTYYWRVTAYDPGFLFYRAAVATFTVNAVNNPPSAFSLISSSGVIGNTLPVFSWQASIDPDADTVSYAVYYSSYQNFSSYVSSAGLVGQTWTAQSALKENSTYYWKVIAQDPFSHFTVSNETFTLIVNATADNPDPFSLVSPADNSTAPYLNPSLDWADASDPDPYDGIAFYILHYSTASDFSVESSSAGLTQSTFTFTAALLNNTSYFWKVAAVSALSGSATSQTWMFRTVNQPPSAFSLLSSSGELNVAAPTLIWQNGGDPEADPVKYTVYYSSYSNFSTYISSIDIVASQYQVSTGLEENRTFYWYIVATDIWGNTRQSAQTWNFTVNAVPENPAAFALTAPANGSVVSTQRPQLDWADTTDPDPSTTITYTLWYSVDPTFASRTAVAGLAASAYNIPSNLTAYSTYYWRVYAVSSDGHQTASADWSFSIGAGLQAAAPANFVSQTVTAGQSVRFTWDAVTLNGDGTALTNLAGYKIFKAYDYDSVFTVAESSAVPAGTLEWTDTAVNNQNIYYIVRAYNTWGVDGLPSLVQFVGPENKTIISDDSRTVVISCPRDVFPSTVTLSITRVPEQEERNVLRAYRITATDSNGAEISYTFARPVNLNFKLAGLAAQMKKAPGSETLTTGIFWNNGVEWVYLGGEKSGTEITAQVTSLGNFQLRTVQRAVQFTTLTIWPKTITPNADNINDEFNMTFENPTSERVEGAVYALDGSQAGRMTAKTDYWLTWNGTNENGENVPAGIYVYQVKCGNKVYNGTVVVAK